jgi:DNA-binding response OmpR family regulator/DNA-binding CsgD family transcriptional regulator
LKKYKILLADDEPQNIINLFESLSPDSYRVFVASNGKCAIEQTLKQQPDAIILDWDMPEMDGMEAIKIIRATAEVKDIPIIVATGKMTSMENLRTALETGANDYIRKPYDPIEIEARLQSMISLNLEQQKSLSLQKEIMQQKIEESQRKSEINAQALTASKMRLIYQSKNNETLIGELKKIRDMVNEEAEKMISKLISKIMSDTSGINWKEFESHFEKVHPSFLSALHSQFPVLTSNEIELCAFIKMDMTNKEIMAITYKTDNTLKKARQRLRKKLGLGADESLYNFINKII